MHASDLIRFGIATVRLPQIIRAALTKILSLEDGAQLPFTLECDDVQTLKRTAIGSDTVLAIVHAAVLMKSPPETCIRSSFLVFRPYIQKWG